MPLNEDAGVAGNDSDTAVEDVAPEVLSHIEDVLSKDDPTAEPPIETEAVPAREQARRAAVKQEEKDELEQEGVKGDGEEQDAPAAEETTEEEGQAPADEQAAEAAVLDPNLRFAAEQFGWTADKIDKLYAADPELATSTFENLLNAFTNLSRQNNPAASMTPQGNPAAQQQAVSRLDKLYSDLKSFAAENGEPLADHFKAIHEEVIVPFRQMQAELAVQKQQAVRAEVNTVVNDLGKQFPAVYGSGDKATLVQQQSRQQLYTLADQFRAGASLQGKEMSVADALKRAHLVLTADQRIAEGRKQVVQQVQKRSKAITARPTQRRNPSAMGVSKGESAAAEAYERRANELGIEV